MLAYVRMFKGKDDLPSETEIAFAFNFEQLNIVRDYFTLPICKVFNAIEFHHVHFLTFRFKDADYQSFLKSDLYKRLLKSGEFENDGV